MNFFEQELRKLAAHCNVIENPVFSGRACYGDLGGDNRIKLQFVTMGVADNYVALKATILNRTDGEVDVNTFRFADVWGRKQVSNPNFKEGFMPHIWTYGLKTEWPVYKPTGADFKQLADAVSAYAEVFTNRSIAPEKAQVQAAKKGRGAKKEIAGRLDAGKEKAAGNNQDKNPATDARRKKPGDMEH